MTGFRRRDLRSRALFTILVALLLTGCVPLPPQRSDPVASTPVTSLADRPATVTGAPEGVIVFQAKSATGADLFSINPDGTDLRQITHGPGLNQEPACSPHGTRIAFTSWRDNTQYLYVVNADGSQERQLVDGPGNVAEPAWSPDGAQIAFNSEADKAFYVMDVDGSDQERLPVTGVNLYSPAWSPDGGRLAYTSYTGRSWDLHIARLDGSDDVNLTGGVGFANQPAWSPDGRQMAFSGNLGETYATEIYVVTANAEGRFIERTQPGRLTNTPVNTSLRNNYSPAWSPDGKQIAFYSDRGGGGFDIWIMNVDGSEQRQLTHGLEASNPCWLHGS